VRKNSVSAGISYGSDALFFGRTGPIRYPFMSTDIIFNTKPGFFIYGSAVKVLGYKPLVDEIDLGGGYYYRLSKKFTGTVSYTRFIFNKEANIIKSSASNDINWKNSYDWKYLKTSATVDYLFGKSYDIFTTISNSKYIESSFNVLTTRIFSLSTQALTSSSVPKTLCSATRLTMIPVRGDNIALINENGRRARQTLNSTC
jgi:hypothetical protein